MNQITTIHLGETTDVEERNQYLRELLKEHDCEITFVKKDGSERVMPCTLRPEVLPLSESENKRKIKPETLSVWCLDKKSWRSFLVANVKSLKVLS